MTDSSPGAAGMTQADFAYLERLAASAAASGLYGGTGEKARAQLLMKLIYGRDLGIPVSAALSGIDIYDGTMELSSNLIAALLEAHPHYAYAVVESGNERCELEFFKDGASLGKATFDTAAATTAGLSGSDYYRQYPSDMFFARAMTRGARRYCPGLGRGVAIYASGELAKRTPEPTGPRGANGSGATSEPRANDRDRRRIRALASEARVSDAELHNVIVALDGGAPVKDEQRAAEQLDGALQSLPIRLIPKVTGSLSQRKAALAPARSANGQRSGQPPAADDAPHATPEA
ncbi:MAG: hypothetical protein M3401_15580 [Actinomycetota bacterium]|nr:hypothetical protein [Actinomycetota bacterium]